MDELNEHEAAKFEDRMVEHLRENFPEECEEMGEEDVREAVRHGVERAGEYGMELEQDVCNYINVMFVYGRDFDTDAELPWAGQILNDPSREDPTDKTDALYDEAIVRLEQEEGPPE
jgi:hypothetical protein